jgi:hypothetical protein
VASGWHKNSFWCGTFWIVTFGCAAWKAVTVLTQTPLSGSAVTLFHQLRMTRPPTLELVDALEPAEVPLLLLHAAIVAAAAATAMATMTGFGKRRMRLIS